VGVPVLCAIDVSPRRLVTGTSAPVPRHRYLDGRPVSRPQHHP
jgi:hypothetical protein